MATAHRPRVFLDVNIGEEPAGRLTIELFADKTPKTCENFRQLCAAEHADAGGQRFSYATSPFHRVIDEFMVQGGDIERGDGTGTTSIYSGKEFADENLNWRELDAAGLVCSANRGRDTNGSQFFITLEPCQHLNGKHTIFGRLVAGEATLQRIAKVEVDKQDRPREPVLIARCGELERRRPKSTRVDEPSPTRQDRGRRRKSDVSDEEMAEAGKDSKKRLSRRQSDNVIDEGLRGRPRQRSGSRSASNALTSTSASRSGSPAEKHKRKRSQSPSRHVNGKSGERRRRSLPNQYANEKRKAVEDDENRYRPSPRRQHDEDRHSRRRHDRAHRGHREDDRYRPGRDYNRYEDGGGGGYSNHDSGRLGSGADGYEQDAPVKFKGRGIMKYREPDRAW